MSVKAQASGEIDFPVSKVFKFHAVKYVSNHPHWDTPMQLDDLTDGYMAVGKKDQEDRFTLDRFSL